MLAENLALAYGSPLVVAALLAVPVWRMLSRVGLSPYWTALLVVPAVGVALALAVLAFGPWPKIEGRSARPRPRRPWGEAPPAPKPESAPPPGTRAVDTGLPRESWRRAGTVERRRRD
jgi:hypothetical protein